jgi:hypothetical protein
MFVLSSLFPNISAGVLLAVVCRTGGVCAFTAPFLSIAYQGEFRELVLGQLICSLRA